MQSVTNLSFWAGDNRVAQLLVAERSRSTRAVYCRLVSFYFYLDIKVGKHQGPAISCPLCPNHVFTGKVEK